MSRMQENIDARMRELSVEIASRLYAISRGDEVKAAAQMNKITAMIGSREYEEPEQMFEAIREALDSIEPAESVGPETGLDRARALAFMAGMETGRRRKQLIRDAIALSPDCAEAYILLGEDAKTPKAAQREYQLAVDAAARVLGADRIQEYEGRLASLTDAGTYIEARVSLAESYWDDGNTSEAISQLEAVITLDRDGPYDLGYLLAAWLIATGDVTGLRRVMGRLPVDASADWLYTNALYQFLRDGPSRHAEDVLRGAIAVNPWVMVFMLAAPIAPEDELDEDSLTEEQADAITIASTFGTEWVKGLGVGEWMIGVMARTLIRPLRGSRGVPTARRRR